MAVYLSIQQVLPRGRTVEILADLENVQISEGTLSTLIKRTAHLLKPVEEQIKTALGQATVIHQDKTGMEVMGRCLWMHVTSTSTLTHYQVHRSREHEALDDIGILAHFAGTSVHDAWKAYFSMDAIIACVVCISCMS